MSGTTLEWSLQFAVVSAVSASLHWLLWWPVLSNVGHHRVVTAVFKSSVLYVVFIVSKVSMVYAPVCSLVSQASTSVKRCGLTSCSWSAVWSALFLLVSNGLCSLPHAVLSGIHSCLQFQFVLKGQLSLYIVVGKNPQTLLVGSGYSKRYLTNVQF